DDEVLDDGGRRHRLERDGAAALADEVLDEDGAGELVLAVDLHRVAPADAVGAALAEGEAPVHVPLDLVEEVEGAVHRVHVREVVLLPVGGLVAVGVVAEDLDGELHKRWGISDWRLEGAYPSLIASHQSL